MVKRIVVPSQRPVNSTDDFSLFVNGEPVKAKALSINKDYIECWGYVKHEWQHIFIDASWEASYNNTTPDESVVAPEYDKVKEIGEISPYTPLMLSLAISVIIALFAMAHFALMQ